MEKAGVEAKNTTASLKGADLAHKVIVQRLGFFLRCEQKCVTLTLTDSVRHTLLKLKHKDFYNKVTSFVKKNSLMNGLYLQVGPYTAVHRLLLNALNKCSDGIGSPIFFLNRIDGN